MRSAPRKILLLFFRDEKQIFTAYLAVCPLFPRNLCDFLKLAPQEAPSAEPAYPVRIDFSASRGPTMKSKNAAMRGAGELA